MHYSTSHAQIRSSGLPSPRRDSEPECPHIRYNVKRRTAGRFPPPMHRIREQRPYSQTAGIRSEKARRVRCCNIVLMYEPISSPPIPAEKPVEERYSTDSFQNIKPKSTEFCSHIHHGRNWLQRHHQNENFTTSRHIDAVHLPIRPPVASNLFIPSPFL